MASGLSKKALKQLKARAHHLKPVLMVGDSGLTDAVVAEAETTISHHELIKIRLPQVERDDRRALIEALAAKLDATIVQSIGRTATLFRKRPENHDARSGLRP